MVGSIGSADVPLVCHHAKGRRRFALRWVRLVGDRRGSVRHYDYAECRWAVAGSGQHCSSSSAHCGRNETRSVAPKRESRGRSRTPKRNGGRLQIQPAPNIADKRDVFTSGARSIAVLYCCAARWSQLDGSVLMVLATRSAAMVRSGMFRFWDTVRSTSNPVSAGHRCMPMMMPMAWSITDREDSAVRR